MAGGRRAERLIMRCGLPQDALAMGARVTMIAQGSVLIEGQRGVVELAPQRIRLLTEGGVLAVEGEGLKLRELSLDAAMITGEPVMAVSYAGTGRNGR